MKLWYVYIMTNKPKGVLYVGMTDNIDARVQEHKTKVFKNPLPQDTIAINWFIWKNTTKVLKHQNGNSK